MCRRYLAPAFVGYAEHCTLGNCVVLIQGVFDLDRIHILRAGNQHVLGTVDKRQESIFVNETNIARQQPTIRQSECPGCFLRIIEILIKYLFAACDDVPDFARRQQMAFPIDDAKFSIDGDFADCPEPFFAMTVTTYCYRAGFGLSVVFRERNVRQHRSDAVEQCPAHWCARIANIPQCLQTFS